MRKEIELVNKIVREAIMHGADFGGSNDLNLEKLVSSINKWLEFHGVLDEYKVMVPEVGAKMPYITRR